MVKHRWYWPFHSWKYSSDFIVDDIVHGSRYWSDYRYCACGREQSRIKSFWGSFGWRDEKDAVGRELAQRYVEACAEYARCKARTDLLDEMKGAPVEEIKRCLAERGLMLKVDR